jgi:hypothetical protein
VKEALHLFSPPVVLVLRSHPPLLPLVPFPPAGTLTSRALICLSRPMHAPQGVRGFRALMFGAIDDEMVGALNPDHKP